MSNKLSRLLSMFLVLVLLASVLPLPASARYLDWGGLRFLPTDLSVTASGVAYDSDAVKSAIQTGIKGKTLAYHCNGSTAVCGYGKTTNGLYRRIDQIGAVNSGEYEGCMITLTPTSDTYSDKLASSCTGNTAGGRAEVNNLEIYNRQGMLVTYYVRSTAETLLKQSSAAGSFRLAGERVELIKFYQIF